MTVQVSDRLSQLYVGNGVNTRFDFMFRAYEQEDETGVGVRIKVGNEFEFIDESEYTVTTNPDNMGGYVTFVNPPSAETFFYIAGKTPVDQLLDITNYDNFYPDALERALDKITAILQEWNHLVDFETKTRILADIAYDDLAKQREADLKAYIDGIASAVIGKPVLGLPSEFVVDGDENQEQINNKTVRGFDSIVDLLVYAPRVNGQTVFVKSYHSGLNKGGGTFVYNSAKKFINDGVVTFNGWVRASFMFITSSMAGCYIDDENDDQPYLQRGIYYCGENKFPFYIDEGIHLCKTANFFRWGSENQYQTNCQIFDIKHDNLKIIGKSKNSIIKYGAGITYTGWEEVGYVGARLFSTRSPSDRINGFELIGLSLDGNGLNNKIRGINPGGTAAGNQAVFIWHGNNNHVKNCVFKDFSGYQVINISYDTYDTVIENNEFINSGWLDGTNWTQNYTDQSTVFLGGSYVCRGNRLIQNTQGMFAGTAFELHGSGFTSGNYIENYAGCFLSASVVTNANNVFMSNTCENCTMLLNTDTQNQLTNIVELMGNSFKQNTMYLSESGIYGKYRSIIYAYAAYNPLKTKLIISANIITTDGKYIGSSNEYLKKFNSVLLLQQTNLVVFRGNIVDGFRGSIARLLRQADDSELYIASNTFENCGVDGTFTHGNSIIYYDNDGAQDYGLTPKIIGLSKNEYNSCNYKSFFSSNIDVVGSTITPKKLTVDGDKSQNWIAPVLFKDNMQIRYDVSFLFDYKCFSQVVDSELNPYVGGYNAINVVGKLDSWNDKVKSIYQKIYPAELFTKIT
ncbi:hypothetical protein [Acinetobacter baumannii]|uniref:hypothetical protein n=1 Tax=Acinetobacter baumannii TaxID=470 RepID=UPI00344B237A